MVAPSPSAVTPIPASQTSAVYHRLRRDLIKATFLPGEKLLIASLCARYAVSLSPVREALNRLSREGLVIHTEQRGFHVPPFSNAHLEDLTKTRGWLNEIGLRESIAHGDSAWEERVVLAYHRLARLPRYVGEPDGERVSEEWENAHREFHESLVAACGSTWLIQYCKQLFDAAERYRNLSRLPRAVPSPRNDDEHRLITEAVVARDQASAIALLHRHFEHTAALVRLSLLESDAARTGSENPAVSRG
jgi:DNA-binding GntR family transcriptional regulator